MGARRPALLFYHASLGSQLDGSTRYCAFFVKIAQYLVDTPQLHLAEERTGGSGKGLQL